MKWVISLLVVGALAVGWYFLFGPKNANPRIEVAKEKLLARIDDALGKLDVQRKEVQNGMDAMKTALDGIRKAKIKAQVRSDQIQQNIAPTDERIAAIDRTLAKLREYLTASTSKPAEIGGKTYTQQELKDMAEKVIQARKECENQIAPQKQAQATLKEVAASMERMQTEYEKKLDTFKNQLATIDAKTIAVKALQDASKAMQGADDTFASNVAKLEDQIAGLHVEVETQLRSETERWNETATVKQIDAVGEFVKGTQPPTDTVADIDKILGTAKP